MESESHQTSSVKNTEFNDINWGSKWHNASHNIDVPLPTRICATYEMHTAAQIRQILATQLPYDDLRRTISSPNEVNILNQDWRYLHGTPCR